MNKDKGSVNKNREHRKTTGIKNPLPRKIHLGQDEWSYTMGQGRFRSDMGLDPVVIIRTPDGAKTQEFTTAQVLKLGQTESGDGGITPSIVKEFLMSRFGGSIAAFKDYFSEEE